MVSTSHIKVSLLSIPLFSGCVITYWSERAEENSDEEKEMTEDRLGTSTTSSRSRSTVQLFPFALTDELNSCPTFALSQSLNLPSQAVSNF